MPTILKKIFKPKWQSSQSETRLDALEGLQWANDEQRAILTQLVQNDPDINVRCGAVSKIADHSILTPLLATADGALRDALCTQLAKLIQSQAAPLSALAANADDAILLKILAKLEQVDVKLALVDQIKTPGLLAELAMQNPSSRIRQRAAEHLQDNALLEEVLKTSKNKDKGVYQTVKAKLSSRREQSKREQEIRQQSEHLCASLENHAVSEAINLYEAKYETLMSQWRGLADDAEEDLVGRVLRAARTCEERIRQMKAEDQRRQREAQESASLQQEREATCATLEQSLATLRQTEAPGRLELPGLDALIKTQENRWLEATRHNHVDRGEQKRYQQAMLQLRHYTACLQKFAALEANLQQLTAAVAEPGKETAGHASENLKQLRAMLEEINWPEDFPAPLAYREAQTSLGHLRDLRKQHSDDLKKLKQAADESISQLEQALEERSLKNSSRLFKEVQKHIHRLPGSIEHEYQGKLRLLHGRLQELKDWHGFATQPKQIELCERMEHLAEQHLEPQLKANRIKELQNEWRALGGSSDQNLWNRFKAASDKAFEPCQQFFAENDLLKQANLEKREMICEQLQDFLDHIHWEQVVWKGMEKISRKAREEWHRFYPVDHKPNKPLQKHFHKLIEEIESHLDQERARNTALKTQIVQRAEALIGEANVREATQAAKLLQREWEAVGITEHRSDRQLWKAFRAACDQIFARLDNEREQHHQEIHAKLERAEQICASLEGLANNPDAHSEQEMNALLHAFRDLGHLPREPHHVLQERCQKAAQKLRDGLHEHKRQQARARWQQLSEQAESLARWEDAQCDGAHSGEDNLQPPQLAQLDIPQSILEQLQERLERANALTSADYQRNRDKARLCCIQAEILAGLDSPAADKTARMEYQMARLSEGFASGHTQRRPIDEMTDILASWYGLGPVEPTLRGELQPRIDHALEQVLRKHGG